MRWFLTLLVALTAAQAPLPPQAPRSAEADPRFAFPCARYEKGLENGRGNFGFHVTAEGSAFRNSWHLAEDVWLPAGTEVRAIADGVVKYSAFSPTWTDDRGFVHWNLGNVIVIEHRLDPPVAVSKREKDGTLDAICSVYVHLGAERLVEVGDAVARGQKIGHIGKDRSDENGRYPEHLHFGIHRGAYVQVAPALERELRRAAASKDGLNVGPFVFRGDIELSRVGDTDLLVTSVATKEKFVLSLLVGSTAPKDPPPDIMGWCEGYGSRDKLDEWLAPSKFLRANGAR